MTDLTLDITSSVYREDNPEKNVREMKAACDAAGIKMGIQLHNTSSKEEIAAAAATGLPLTAHAPLLSDWQMNMAAEDFSSGRESLESSASVMRRYGIDTAVVHGFVMTDVPVPSFGRGRSYDEGMSVIFRPELAREESTFNNDFYDTDEFEIRRLRVKQRLAEIRDEFSDLQFCIENDFPNYGAGNLFVECADSLDNPLCLDTAHLWASAFLFGRDFLTETRRFVDTGKVKMVHLHASPFTADVPEPQWGDGHMPLSTPNNMNLPEFVRICHDGGIRHFVLEIRGITVEDIHRFADMWSNCRI